jgi:hypothetical protein
MFTMCAFLCPSHYAEGGGSLIAKPKFLLLSDLVASSTSGIVCLVLFVSL